VLQSFKPCLRVKSNAYPGAFMEDMRALSGIPKVASSIHEALEGAVKPEYLVGCAVNFLFSFDEAYSKLLSSARLLLSGPILSPPERFVAVHLRFGDRVFQGDDNVDQSLVSEALRCAAELGLERFGRPQSDGDDWGIFFASDSVAARRLALSEAQQVGVPVMEISVQPSHINMDTGQPGEEQIWGSLADHLMLGRAGGLVQCWDEERQCGYSAFGQSGFALVAAQEELLDVDNYRLITPEGCQQRRMFVG
jgi:hypothetical protein